MEQSSDGKTVVIIGDWFIDENWLVSKQKIYHSSNTGDIHFQARHKSVTEPIISLCGAAAIMEVLSSHFKKDSSYKFIGVGSWNHNDDDIIQCVLCAEYREDKLLTPFTLASLKKLKGTESERICPYSDSEVLCIYDEHNKDLINISKQDNDIEVSTNRIIRCYEGFGGEKPHLLHRVDWVLPITNSSIDYEELVNALHEKNIAAIIIVDHGYGLIDKCINILTEKASPETDWYIRTKINEPLWMKSLKEKSIEPKLIVSDYQLVTYKKGERLWRYGKWLSRAALEQLGEMTGDKIYRHQDEIETDSLKSQFAAVLLDDNNVFGKNGDNCFIINQPPEPKQLINIGRTTIFYTSLIAQLLQAKDTEDNDFYTKCTKALDCAYNWSKGASKLWNDNKPFFYGDYTKALKESNEGRLIVADNSEYTYKELWELWKESSNELGIVNLRGRKALQLWRGEGTLSSYICVGSEKRDSINRLVSSIAAFKRDKFPSHPLSCLLISSPGWGKSFLANCLAKHFDMEYLEFSIAQMATSQDLLDSLTRIASVQNRIQKKTLVFIDEVNAKIEGNSVMSLLLSPIWDKMITVDGINYRLKPGVWVFASTDPIIETSSADTNSEKSSIVALTKGSDFVSRLNGPIIDLDSLGGPYVAEAIKGVRNELNTMVGKGIEQYLTIYSKSPYTNFKNASNGDAVLKTEQVYIMVSLLQELWGPISRVQECVLKLFYDTLPVNGLRSLKFFASNFENVRKGELVVSNVPEIENREELRRHVILPEEWLISKNRKVEYSDPRDDNEFVDIEKLSK